jgi:YidC/Oxa1 family membrane protein insertase
MKVRILQYINFSIKILEGYILSKGIKITLLFIFTIILLTGCDSASAIHNSDISFWNRYLIYPFSLAIIYIGNAWFHQSIGFSIMLFTVGVRMLLAPLNIVQQKNQMKTKQIQPQIKELKEKYTLNDAESQQQYQREMMTLLKENGANPLLGCLPLLIQLPVLSVVYYAIKQINTMTSSPFLWMDLGQADPYFLLPILAAVATYFQSKLMQSDIEGANAPYGKALHFLSPIMILVFGLFSPSGLVLYWMTGTIFMIVQSLVLKRFFSKDISTNLE